jgi:hypothetical protein
VTLSPSHAIVCVTPVALLSAIRHHSLPPPCSLNRRCPLLRSPLCRATPQPRRAARRPPQPHRAARRPRYSSSQSRHRLLLASAALLLHCQCCALTLTVATSPTSLRPSSGEGPSRDFFSARLFRVTLIFSFGLPMKSHQILIYPCLSRHSRARPSFPWNPRASRSLTFSSEFRSSEVACHDFFFSYLVCLLS